MAGLIDVLAEAPATDCALCRRSVLMGEMLFPFHDVRVDRSQHVCDLCRVRADERGWESNGEPQRRGGSTKLRVHARMIAAARPEEPVADVEPIVEAPQAAILERLEAPMRPEMPDTRSLLGRVRQQELELQRMRGELDPSRRAEEQGLIQRQATELKELRAALREKDARIERLQQARHSESSPYRMTGFALDAFNQSADLERMARIARTLGSPVVNVHDEGAGIPRRVRVTLSWDIAWYEFVVKLDLGVGRASVHETGTGGDPTSLPLERRRANAAWRDSGIVLA
ncbi:MAG: hypothetical protein JWM25_302 [Thermoleophilia bacterium]|nr:hypothetical protein [Thermoleophilia bacterium]MCZ4495719.1 hypothetical protein [Thermoleophilia bacterium]